MLLPLEWLKNYITLDLDTKAIADGLSDSGSHVESIQHRSLGLSKVVIGKIEKIEKHPDADKLVICSVNVGQEVLTIVTGAKNVYEGAVVPVALVGAHLAKGVKIKKGKLRGVESLGMLCSLEELGFDTSVIPKEARDGIYLFDEQEELPLGSDAMKALDMTEEVLELEITPNRPDCLSILGMAIESAATFDRDITYPDTQVQHTVEDIHDYVTGITLDSPNCRRYYSRVLKNVQIKSSPQWLKNYLMAAGIRPVSNMVDLTNFVMLECGQPLHAFDLNDLFNHEIIVRQAAQKEKLITLDGTERTLETSDIVIADGEKAIGLAGVMGGLNSEIKETTTTVLLEGANFVDDCIRKTSKRLGLRSDASSRYEKGLDPNLAQYAVDRVCHLAEQMGIAEVVGGTIDIYPIKREPKFISLSISKCNDLIGVDLSADEMKGILNRLEIKTELQGDILQCKVPTFRLDLEIEEDLVEEISRVYGFSNIQPKPLSGAVTIGGKPKFRKVADRIKTTLLGLGYSEYMTYSFVSPSDFDKIMLEQEDELRNSVNLLNPLGEDYSVMRTTLIPEMIDALAKNFARGNENVAGFEFGNTFTPTKEELPQENIKLCMGFYDIGDFYYLKESVERAFWTVGITGLEVRRGTRTFLHPGRCAEVYYQGEYLGVLGEIHPTVLKNYGIKKRAYVGEFDFYKIVDNTTENYLYEEMAKYPHIKRDLSFVLNRDIDSVDLEKICIAEGSKLLESFHVFDIYEGEHIEQGKKSVAFSLVFRAKDRTLEEQEINGLVEKIIEKIQSQLQGVLRS